VRLDGNGEIAAMAAGGLKRFGGPGLSIDLDERIDLALWRSADGQWQGVLQGLTGPIPPALQAITQDWTRLRAPTRLQ